MKLFWRLLMGMLAIIILSFTVFGTVLLQTSFHSSLEREKENSLEEMHMFQYTFLASMEGLSESSYTMDEETLRVLAESIGDNVGDNRNSFCIYNETGNSIYPVGQQAGDLFRLLQEENKKSGICIWRLEESGGSHVIDALVRMESGGEIYYLGVQRDIQYVYDNRALMIRNYRTALLLLSGMAAVLSALLAAAFTRPIRRLSQATRAFSEGNYDKRVRVEGSDEMALLMQDFNQMADQLQANIRSLRESARRQEEFTGAFAHELKTPLTSMIGYGEMLLMMDLPEEDRRQSADYIYRESKRLERLAYKMMELIQLGKGELSMGTVEMNQLGRDLQNHTAALLETKKISYCFDFQKGTIRGDWDLLLSLLGNLVDNARKACRMEGEITVSGREKEDGSYQVCVIDDGCGMPEEEACRITEAFYMIDKSRARKEGGAGLGLAICERIIKVHHAEWKIESKEGEGTKITILFPEEEAAHENEN